MLDFTLERGPCIVKDMSKLQVILGDESFLVEEAVRTTTKAHPDFESQHFEDRFSWDLLFQALSESSLFGDNFLIYIKNPWFLVDTASDDDIKALTKMMDLLMNSPHIVIIYTLGASVDQRRKGFTTLKKHCTPIVYTAFKDWETDKVIDWTKQRTKSLGKSLDHKAAEALVQAGGTHLRLIASELDKLAVYTGSQSTIRYEDVAAVCSSTHASIFKLTDALKIRHHKNLLDALETLMDQGEDPLKLIGLLAATLRLYIQILDLASQGFSPDHMGKELGKHPFFIKQLLPDLQRNHQVTKLSKTYQQLAELDWEIKTGKIQAKSGLTTLLMKV